MTEECLQTAKCEALAEYGERRLAPIRAGRVHARDSDRSAQDLPSVGTFSVTVPTQCDGCRLEQSMRARMTSVGPVCGMVMAHGDTSIAPSAHFVSCERALARPPRRAMSLTVSHGLQPPQRNQAQEQETVKIAINTTVISCGLTLTLSFFSRERPQKGEPPMASAHLTLQKNEATKGEVELSMIGTDASGRTYTQLLWYDYRLELVAPWDYDRSITVKVTRI